MFRTKDRDGTGWLKSDELEECLNMVGVDIIPEDMEFLQERFDKNGDGHLQIEELMDNLHVLYQHAIHRDELMTAFNTFDINKDGYIRYTELQNILTFRGFMSADESRKTISMLSKYDRNKDGKFSYSEFVEMYLSDEFADTVTKRHEEIDTK
ncbi:hypothetical protein LSH36_965g01028 [Paralvinella palmiformis]|uniref:EF-hand domain-containing protein n=1 Tax=Paralvinella palmiformis TaxID=53620 RepID=A0AAD9IWQ6_9ANNE|nr:hypothetical protein LSH36_965g01028 [Paralvinella palmiformis]